MAKLLVIDDDPSLLRALRVGLQAGGHEVVTAANGEQGVTAAATNRPDVVVLDLGLPDIDGIEVCRRIRQWSEVPIVMLSATEAEDRKVAALDGGANDYVTKPFGLAELEARIRVALRTRTDLDPGPPVISVGALVLEVSGRDARLNGQPVELTAKEFDVLAYLGRHAGKRCTHEMILSAVWGPGYGRENQYLHAYIHRLRQKLGDQAGELIRTAPGIGYVLDGPGDTAVE